MSDYTFRSTEQDGMIREVELSPQRAHDLGAVRVPTPRDEAG